MMKIKPRALLVCGFIADSNPGRMTKSALKHALGSRINMIELEKLLEDMVSAGMLWIDKAPGYADEYYLKTFQTEIS